MQKKCFKCGETKSVSCFYKHKGMADGYLGKCKDCAKKDVKENRDLNKEYYLEYDRNRLNAKERTLKQSLTVKKKIDDGDVALANKIKQTKQKWADNNPNKRKAQVVARNAIKSGKLIQSPVCECCGCNSCQIQGHHWSYEPDNYLDVIWLCTSCHGKEHKAINNLKRNGKEPYENGKEILQLAEKSIDASPVLK